MSQQGEVPRDIKDSGQDCAQRRRRNHDCERRQWRMPQRSTATKAASTQASDADLQRNVRTGEELHRTREDEVFQKKREILLRHKQNLLQHSPDVDMGRRMIQYTIIQECESALISGYLLARFMQPPRRMPAFTPCLRAAPCGTR